MSTLDVTPLDTQDRMAKMLPATTTTTSTTSVDASPLCHDASLPEDPEGDCLVVVEEESSNGERVDYIRIPRGLPGRSILKKSAPSNETADSTRSGGTSRREVSFHTIHIRYHPMILGDNPACSFGAPVQLDWECIEEEKHDLDVYEVERRPRRRLRHLVLSYYRRKDILMQAGFNEDEMRSSEKQIGKLKRQRKTTGFFLPIQKMEEVVQSAGRKVRRASSKTRKKKDDQQQ